MRLSRRLARAARRWDRAAAAVSVLLPLTVSGILGFFWLIEHGWFLWFVGISALLAAVALILRWIGKRQARLARARLGEVAEPAVAVAADPDWSEVERAAYARACARIEARTAEAMEWEALLPAALEELRLMAEDLGKRRELDFSLPEALLLIEHAAARYRGWLRRNLPLADTVTLRQIERLWRHRASLGTAWSAGYGVWRLARLVRNPLNGLAREAEAVFSDSNSSWLGGQMLCVLQAILLEEIAHAAVDLYSGRLRFSDAELAGLAEGAARRDRARLAAGDLPLRILLVGQVSAGKSTLLNALAGADRSETDMAATTARYQGYAAEIDGVPCHLIDAPGLDGGDRTRGLALKEMLQADLVLWLVRTDRPGRAPDVALLRDFRAAAAADPGRRLPPLLALASAADRMMPGWPFPDHDIAPKALARLAEALSAIRADLPGLDPLPVVAVAPEWNLERLREIIGALAPEAVAVQRQRLRREGAEAEQGLRREIGRGARGIWDNGREIGGRLWRQIGRSAPRKASGPPAAPPPPRPDPED